MLKERPCAISSILAALVTSSVLVKAQAMTLLMDCKHKTANVISGRRPSAETVARLLLVVKGDLRFHTLLAE